ncbi:MAG: adenosylcobinamide-GDP ribazoletransferase [Planctomycetes bacterium]|nr:adenosylcobinamide-GDP ribazoletransferase [Planctomycetota bacterium]
MKRFIAAVQFLTIVPVPGSWGHAEEHLAGSVPFFPVVGLLIGSLAAALAFGLSKVLPPLPTSVLIVIVLLGASGALHLDGLSDTADGFLSARQRERILEIMRDSHVGAMGVIAVVCVLLLKVAALASLPGATMWRVTLLMPLAGRCGLVVTMWALPYARPEGGLGTVFYKKRPRLAALWAVVVLLAAGVCALRMPGLVAAGASLAVVLLFAAYTRRKIAGATGDALGAACEIAEAVPPLAIAAWLHPQ